MPKKNLKLLKFAFIFFSPTSQKTPCRDPSTVEYSEPALPFLVQLEITVHFSVYKNTQFECSDLKRKIGSQCQKFSKICYKES